MATILIADDSPSAVLLLRRILQPLGHEIKVATDGAEAERALFVDGEPPDLAILDIIMPHKNGFELCRALKADPRTARVPVVLVTWMDRQADRFWGLKQGADEYLPKPVDAERLIERVRALLP
jgi:twitching motility two-component system response regulator PilH